MSERGSGRVASPPGHSGSAPSPSVSASGECPSRNEALIAEAANFDEMAKHSYKRAFIRDLRGDQAGTAFWRGRARGLELAAINVRAAASAMEAEGRDAQQLGAKPSSAVGNAETPNPLPQNHHDRSGAGSEVKED